MICNKTFAESSTRKTHMKGIHGTEPIDAWNKQRHLWSCAGSCAGSIRGLCWRIVLRHILNQIYFEPDLFERNTLKYWSLDFRKSIISQMLFSLISSNPKLQHPLQPLQALERVARSAHVTSGAGTPGRCYSVTLATYTKWSGLTSVTFVIELLPKAVVWADMWEMFIKLVQWLIRCLLTSTLKAGVKIF